MTLENLWAGWRHTYVSSATNVERAEAASEPVPSVHATADQSEPTDTDQCVFCRIAASGPPSEDNLIVWRDETVVAVLNLYPYASGHILVMPARHVGDLAGLSEDEATKIWSASRAAVEAVNASYQPDGINLGANLGRAAGAGIPRHLHLHIVPRWSGDTNFMTTIAGTRVMPQALTDSWAMLRQAWEAPQD